MRFPACRQLLSRVVGLLHGYFTVLEQTEGIILTGLSPSTAWCNLFANWTIFAKVFAVYDRNKIVNFYPLLPPPQTTQTNAI